MDPRYEDLAAEYFRQEVFRTGDFLLRSGRRSPFYADFKRLRSAVEARKETARLLAELLSGLNLRFDRLADIPIGGSPVVNTLSDMMDIPYITPRANAKNYGTESRIEGSYDQGMSVLPGEDVTTSGGSLLEGINTLREGGLIVTHAFVVLNRSGQEPKKLLSDNGVILISLFNDDDIPKMLKAAYERGTVTDEMYEKIRAYLANS